MAKTNFRPGSKWGQSGTSIYNLNTGNVGIGTTSPATRLHVNGTGGVTPPTLVGATVAVFTGSSANSNISIISSTVGASQIGFGDTAAETPGLLRYDNNDNSFALWTNGSEKVRLTSTGNVGIGTTNPSNKLHVQKNSSGRAWSSDSNDIFIMENNVATSFDFITGNTTSAFLLFSDTDARARGWIQYNHSDDSLNFRTAGTSNRLVISNTGNVGVNQASPTSKLFVTGSDSTVPALSVKAASNTPTGDVFEVQNTSGTAVLASRYISGTASGTLGLYVGGNIAVGGTALVAHALVQASANATDPTTNTFGVNASRTVSVTSSNSNPVTGGSFNVSTAGQNFALTGQLTGGSFSIQNGNINTVSNAKGGNFLLYNTGAGTITNGYAGYFLIQNLNASGVITNAYGAYISLNVNVNSGTLTNTYGLYIDDMTHGTQTNQAYGIYVADANARNYIADKVGIGQTSPTAVLHLKAGTSSANTAPLKLTSGTNLATAEAGAFEYDGTNLYFTPSGTTRRTVAYLPTSPPDYTVTNGTEDRTFDADATTTEELADVLSTLIADLTTQGVLQ